MDWKTDLLILKLLLDCLDNNTTSSKNDTVF
jgi:hypothetical protein